MAFRIGPLTFTWVAVALLSLSCQRRDSVAPTAGLGPMAIYFTKGDPHALIDGATLDPHSPLTEADMQHVSDYSIEAIEEFHERDAAAGQHEAATESDRTLRVRETGDGRWNLTFQAGQIWMTFARQSDASVQLIDFGSGSSHEKLNVLHWSVTHDRSDFSVLFESTNDLTGRTLVAIILRKTTSPAALPASESSKYEYLKGAGKKIIWPPDQPAHIDLCGTSDASDEVASAVSKWREALAGNLDLQFSVRTNFAPFSDLNQHCVYFVDTYLTRQGARDVNSGTTLTILSPDGSKILDADVFIFHAELAKLYTGARQQGYSPREATQFVKVKREITILHELGHVLGLGHQFDGTPSIMSYAIQTPELQAYDVEAIRALYKPVHEPVDQSQP